MAIDVKEEKQKLKINLNIEEDFIPEYVRDFYTSNIIQRALSHLYGWDYDQKKPVKLKALSNGILVVAQSGSGFTNNETHSGTVTDSSIIIEFTRAVNRVDIWNGSEALTIERDSGDGVFQDSIKVYANQFYSFDAVTKRLRLVSTSTGTDYQIVGWW